jgi:hypothetical protein
LSDDSSTRARKIPFLFLSRTFGLSNSTCGSINREFQPHISSVYNAASVKNHLQKVVRIYGKIQLEQLTYDLIGIHDGHQSMRHGEKGRVAGQFCAERSLDDRVRLIVCN